MYSLRVWQGDQKSVPGRLSLLLLLYPCCPVEQGDQFQLLGHLLHACSRFAVFLAIQVNCGHTWLTWSSILNPQLRVGPEEKRSYSLAGLCSLSPPEIGHDVLAARAVTISGFAMTVSHWCFTKCARWPGPSTQPGNLLRWFFLSVCSGP